MNEFNKNIKISFKNIIKEIPLPDSFNELNLNFYDYFDEKSSKKFIYYYKDNNKINRLNSIQEDFEKELKEIINKEEKIIYIIESYFLNEDEINEYFNDISNNESEKNKTKLKGG